MSDHAIPEPDDEMPDLDVLLAQFAISGGAIMARLLMGLPDGEAIRQAVLAHHAELNFAVEVGPVVVVVAYEDGRRVLGEWRPDLARAMADFLNRPHQN
jgi:hypothetical protein